MTAPRRARLARAAALALALAAAPVARAEESAAQPQPGSAAQVEPAAQPEAEPASEAAPQPRFLFDLGWDDGPTYEIGQHFPLLESYDWAEVARDVRVKGRIGGSLYLDGGMLAGGALSDGPRFELRRARLNTRGEAQLLLRTEYKIEFAYEDREFFLNDFFLRWRPPRYVDTVRFGYFDPPVSLAALTGSSDRSLMEMAAPVLAFAPGYRLGVEVTGSQREPSLNWSLNLSSVGQAQPDTEATSASALRAVGRLVWRPLGEERAGEQLLHLGISASQVVSGSGDLHYRARPETFLTPYLVDTGKLDGNATLLALEGAWRRAPFSAAAEYLRAFVDSDDEGSLQFQGAYVQLAWVLTGESRPYDSSHGVFQRIEPAQPFQPFQARWGAFELATRLSWLDLSSGDVRGGRMLCASFGPTWTWNRWVRLLAGYVYSHVSDRPERSHAHVVQARLELRL